MGRITWNQPGDKRYKAGTDRGVLFLPDGRGVAWNGITEVVEKTTRSVEPIYFDGRKIGHQVISGDFEAGLSAIQCPIEFYELEGLAPLRRGAWIGDQVPDLFGLVWRVMIGDDLSPDPEHYELHIAWNLMATPTDKTYSTLGGDPSLTPFTWDLFGTPEDIPGRRPACHVVLDSSQLDPWLIEEIETYLYGSIYSDPTLAPIAVIVELLENWARLAVWLNDDETVTLVEGGINHERFFIGLEDEDGDFELKNVNITYLDEDTFVISNIDNHTDIARIDVRDNFDGTVTVSTDDDNVIVVIDEEEGIVEIRSLDFDFVGPDQYRISSQNTPH